MNSYNPEANLRILGGKQERLHGEAWDALRAQAWMEVTDPGSFGSQRWRELNHEWNTKNAQEDRMYDVIHFLRDEVERVNSDVVSRGYPAH